MYEWEPIGEAREQLVVLPPGMIDDFAEAVDGACANPWGFQRRPDEKLDDHHAHRSVPFGPGGMMTFLIMDHERMIYVTSITWLG